MATERDSTTEVEEHPAVELHWMDPEELVQSRLYDDDPTRGETLHESVESRGVLEPVLGRIEDGEIAICDGWRRVEGARASGKQVPVWLPEEGRWNDEKVLLARLLANTAAHQEEMDWLRRAWVLDEWWETVGTTLEPSPTEVADKLDISEKRARDWFLPVSKEWERTILDQDMYENGEIRRDDDCDEYVISGWTITDVLDALNIRRLRDIRTIAYESKSYSSKYEKDVLVKFLNGYAREDIGYDELKAVKQKVKDETIHADEALKRVRDTEDQTVETAVEGDLAAQVAQYAREKNVDEEHVITEATKQHLRDSNLVERPTQRSPNHEYVGQADFLDENVEGSFPVPDLRMESNEHMTALSDESVHLTVTSPPYNVNWEYGPEQDDHLDYVGEYLPMLADTFSEVYRVTSQGGFLCLVVPFCVDVPNDEIEVPEGTLVAHDLVDLLTTECEWEFHDFVIWYKGYHEAGLRHQPNWPRPPRESLNNFTEAMPVFKKPGERAPSSYQEKTSRIIQTGSGYEKEMRDNVWNIHPTQWEPQHTKKADTAQFPEELARRCILHWSYVGDTVLDPYAGRGTTLKMAKRLYRESIGYEIQEELERDIREYVGIG